MKLQVFTLHITIKAGIWLCSSETQIFLVKPTGDTIVRKQNVWTGCLNILTIYETLYKIVNNFTNTSKINKVGSNYNIW